MATRYRKTIAERIAEGLRLTPLQAAHALQRKWQFKESGVELSALAPIALALVVVIFGRRWN